MATNRSLKLYLYNVHKYIDKLHINLNYNFFLNLVNKSLENIRIPEQTPSSQKIHAIVPNVYLFNPVKAAATIAIILYCGVSLVSTGEKSLELL